MDFTPQCPRCMSHDVKLVGSHDHYPAFVPRLPDTPPEFTVFAYQCRCGLAFTFEIKHGAIGQTGRRVFCSIRQTKGPA